MTIQSSISARVISNKPLQKGSACKYFRIALALAKPVKKVIPGQFIHIRLDSKNHILPRPFTIYDISNRGRPARTTVGGGVIEVVYQVIGQGTEMMSRLKPGHKVRVLCPLGNGFRIDKKSLMSVLVGGGVGSAGLYLLLKQMMAQQIKNTYLFLGARSKSDLCLLPEFRRLNPYIVVATEDGSLGTKGLITASLEKFLNNSAFPIPHSRMALYSCGPSGMSQAIRKISMARRIPAQLSLEARMACGVGLCRVCVCKTGKGYSSVCEDGPVFDARELSEA